MIRRLGFVVSFVLLTAALAACAFAQTPARIGDLTLHPGSAPRRLVGYGLVTGLDGSGDRSFGSASGSTPSVRSVVNLLRRFQVEVPADQLRLRNVAAVAVTAEISPWLHAGGRFEVQVSALGDATSLRGGVLWITPLVTDPEQPPIATAQGNLYVSSDESTRGIYGRRSNTARVPQGGVLEVDPGDMPAAENRLLLRQPDLATASRIAQAIDAAFGAGTAKVDDPGSVSLTPKGAAGASALQFLAAVDTVSVFAQDPARIVIDGREGTVVAGGTILVGSAVIHHQGVTLAIGGPRATAADSTGQQGLVRMDARATVQQVAEGLHAAGVKGEDVAAIFESLQAAGALRADVVVR